MLRRVVMPIQDYLVATMTKNPERWQDEINARAQLFVRVCIFGAEEVGMKEMIRLSEEFVFCEALEAKWSNQIRHKCSCPDFFRSAQCEHVVVLAMLVDPSTSMEPVNADLKKVRQRAGKKRGRPAGDGDCRRGEGRSTRRAAGPEARRSGADARTHLAQEHRCRGKPLFRPPPPEGYRGATTDNPRG